MAEIPAIKRRLVQQGVDVIDVGAGDADFAPPEVAVEALAHAICDPAMSRYAFQLGLPAFREAAAAYMRRRFGVRFDPFTELHPLLGSKEGIAHLAMALLDPGDVAIVPEPGYAVYEGGTVLAGAEPYRYALTPRTGFLLELDEIPTDVLRRAKLVYLNYPNNPTATIAPREYLERTVAFCRKHGIVIVYDNPYCEITFDGHVAPSIFEIAGARDIAVEFHSLSKTFCMTGWRLAWAAGRPELIAALGRVKNYVDTGAFLAVQAAGAAVLPQAEELAHVTIIVLAFSGSWRIDRPQGLITIIPPSPPQPPELPPFGGTRRGVGPSGGLGRPVPNAGAPDTTRPIPAPVGRPDTTLAASPRAEGPHIVSPPQVGDGRLWVSPRPALPTEVADVLYEPQESRDTTVVHRLRAMVDSLNVVIDQDQRSRQRPVWTTDVAGKVFGIDSQFIHVAGIKIPTAALALLPITLPQGNYDEQRRARQLDEMREDLMQAARRTETLRLFKQYVRDLRARKQAERDAARRARGDTTEVVKDTANVVP